jgi:hypothetical protein
MGANATTFVPAYVAGEVLTAADLSVTNSGIPVFADSTARDNSFGGTGEKVLAEGQYAYLESTNQTLVYDGSNWISVGVSPGLVLIKTQTIGSAVASVTVSDAFSTTYENYKITISGGVGSTDASIGLQMGATTSGYYASLSAVVYSSQAALLRSDNNAAKWTRAGGVNTGAISMNLDIFNPFTAHNTLMFGNKVDTGTGGGSGAMNGFLNNTTSYTAFTISPDAGTITGGTIRVYGYANS